MIYSYIFDFLSVAFENKVINEKMKKIILFGSVARNDYDNKSDIDLFFDINLEEDIKKIENEVNLALKSFETQKMHKWAIKKINFSIRPIVGKLDSEKWDSLRQDIISNGIMLYGKFESKPDNLRHYALLYFKLEKLPRKEKMKIIRELYGYKNIKNKKTYYHKGFIEQTGCIKIGPNNILAPLIEITNIKKIFSDYRITPKIIEIWMR